MCFPLGESDGASWGGRLSMWMEEDEEEGETDNYWIRVFYILYCLFPAI